MMKIARCKRLIAVVVVLAVATQVAAAEMVRIGVPSKVFYGNALVEMALQQKLFAKEGVTAELSIYRGGAEVFEAMVAGAADVILTNTSLVAAGHKKGVMSQVVAKAALGYYGFHLMVRAKSPLDIEGLNGKKVAITSAGSGTDVLALWTMQNKNIEFTRVPVGGGVVPNLSASNVDAAVIFPPLSYQVAESGEARSILDYGSELPPNLAAGWITLESYAREKPQLVQKTLNALYGALLFMRGNKEPTVKLIADLYEIPMEIATLEYEKNIMKLETDGSMSDPKIPDQLQLALDLAKAGGMSELSPATEIISTRFNPVPTKP